MDDTILEERIRGEMGTNAPIHDLGSLRIHDRERKSSKMGKGLGIFFGLLIILGGIAAAVYALVQSKPVVQVAMGRKSVGPAAREALLNATGYVTPRQRATIAAKITGRVTGVFFDEGTHVHNGQLLATLDDADARRAMETAKADHDSAQAAIQDYEVQLKNAQILLHRTEELQKAGVQPQEQLDNARTAADSLGAKIALAKAQANGAEARIRESQQAVDNCTIRAPFDGIVVSKDAQVGEMVSPISAGGGFTRTGIATIVDMNSNEIEVDVNEAYITRVKPGQQVTAILDAYPDWEIPSRVRTIIPSADRQKATVKVRISFLKLDPRILPDMGIKVTFLGDEASSKDESSSCGILIPQSAVHDEGGKKVVFLVRGDKAERRAVTLAGNRGTDAEVIAGLTADDAVIVNGPTDLHDGLSVQVKK
jgi:RND family efflux transporter MFP subunit